jgi:hypothetical protein
MVFGVGAGKSQRVWNRWFSEPLRENLGELSGGRIGNRWGELVRAEAWEFAW